MEDRSYRRNRALATPLAHVRGFPANEIECALISMMARSIVKRSTDRSDTLVQDPTSPAERLSPCNTPPVHTNGSQPEVQVSSRSLACHVGYWIPVPPSRKRANHYVPKWGRFLLAEFRCH